MRRRTVVLIVTVLILAAHYGATEFLLRFSIRYAELWVRYFMYPYAVVACMIAYYLTVTGGTGGIGAFNIGGAHPGCGQCKGCMDSHALYCTQDPYPSVHLHVHEPAPLPDIETSLTLKPMTALLPKFILLTDPEYILPVLCENKVLTLDELEELQSYKSNRRLIIRLVSIMERKGHYGVKGMITSLRAEKEQCGHRELAEILSQYYHSDDNCEADSATSEHELHTQPSHGMNTFKSCTFTVRDRSAQRFEWKGYGVIVVVDSDTASNESPVQVHVSICLSGQFHIPPEFNLISAIVCVSTTGKPAKPIHLHVQHCANIRNRKDLASLLFVGAPSTGCLPYNFEPLKGKESFSDHSRGYGVVSLKNAQHGLLVAVARQKVKHSLPLSLLSSSSEVPCKYRLMVFYALLSLTDVTECVVHLVVTRDHEPWQNILVRNYFVDQLLLWDEEASKEVTLEKETITAVIPENTALQNGWKVLPPSDPGISRQKVDSLTELGQLSLRVRWEGPKETDPAPLDCKVELKGLKKPSNFTWIHFNPSFFRNNVRDIATLYTM